MDPEKYPESEKLLALNGKNYLIGEFLDWLQERGYYLCRLSEASSRYYEASPGNTPLIADFFDVDLNQLEKEKAAMLAAYREQVQEFLYVDRH